MAMTASQRRILTKTENEIRGTDPRLASILGTFSRLQPRRADAPDRTAVGPQAALPEVAAAQAGRSRRTAGEIPRQVRGGIVFPGCHRRRGVNADHGRQTYSCRSVPKRTYGFRRKTRSERQRLQVNRGTPPSSIKLSMATRTACVRMTVHHLRPLDLPGRSPGRSPAGPDRDRDAAGVVGGVRRQRRRGVPAQRGTPALDARARRGRIVNVSSGIAATRPGSSTATPTRPPRPPSKGKRSTWHRAGPVTGANADRLRDRTGDRGIRQRRPSLPGVHRVRPRPGRAWWSASTPAASSAGSSQRTSPA